MGLLAQARKKREMQSAVAEATIEPPEMVPDLDANMPSSIPASEEEMHRAESSVDFAEPEPKQFGPMPSSDQDIELPPLPEPPIPLPESKAKKKGGGFFGLFARKKEPKPAEPEIMPEMAEQLQAKEEYQFAPSETGALDAASAQAELERQLKADEEQLGVEMPAELPAEMQNVQPALPEPPEELIPEPMIEHPEDMSAFESGFGSEQPGKEFVQPTVDIKKDAGKKSLFDIFRKKKKEEPAAAEEKIELPSLPAEEPSKPALPPLPDVNLPEPPSFDHFDSLSWTSDSWKPEAEVHCLAEPASLSGISAQVPGKEAVLGIAAKATATGKKSLPPVPSMPAAWTPDAEAPSLAEPEIMEAPEEEQATRPARPSKAVMKLVEKREKVQKDVLTMRKELTQLEKEHSQKMRMMQDNERILDQKEKIIDQKMKQLEDLKLGIEALRNEISTKSEKMEKLKALADQTFADRKALESRMQDLTSRESMILDKEKKAEDRHAQASAKEDHLSEREARISAVEREVAVREREVVRKEGELAMLSKKLSDKEKKIAETEAMLADRDSKVRQKEDKLHREYKELEDGEFKEYIDEILKEISAETAKVRHPVYEAKLDEIRPELVTYIQKHIKKGFREDRIMNALIGAGWKDREVKAAMNEVLGKYTKDTGKARQLPPVLPSENQEAVAAANLGQLTDIITQVKKMIKEKKISEAQRMLLQAKSTYDSLRIDDHRKELLRFELQDLKTDIDLALLG